MIHSKKAQPIGQIMMYLVAVIILSLIIGYGYTAITHFRERGDEVIYIKFKYELKELVKKTAHDYDSTLKEVLDVPAKYASLCFIDVSKEENAAIKDEGPFLLVYDSWETGASQNVFLVEESGTLNSFELDYFRISGGAELVDYLCFNVDRSRVNIEFYGQGDAALIRKWI